MATEVATASQPEVTKADSGAGLEQFKERLNALVRKAASGEDDFNFPKGAFEGVVAWEPLPGQLDIFLTYTPDGADDDKIVEIHIYPSKSPRSMYDDAKEAALKPDPWDKIVGWVDSPSGFPNRNEYDDIRMSGLEEKQPWNVRWVQQKQGDAGGYFVRLETSYQAPKDYLKDYADALWNIVNQAGYYDPAE